MDKDSNIGNNLMEELGLSNLPQAKQAQLVVKMTEAILKRIFLETMEKLDEKGREEYEKLLESGADSQKVEHFLSEKINDYDSMVQKVIDDFKEEMKKEA